MDWYYPTAALFFVAMGVFNLREQRRGMRSRAAMDDARSCYEAIVKQYEGYCESMAAAIASNEESTARCNTALQRAEKLIAEATQTSFTAQETVRQATAMMVRP
jgi:hypothetical protein